MTRSRQIIFASGLGSPIAAWRWPYFAPDTSLPGATDYTGRYDPNPYEPGSYPDSDSEDEATAGEQEEQASSEKEMTAGEARAWLGVSKRASKDEITAAWRAVLKQVHRDGGDFVTEGVEGNYRDYLVRKINEAREVLLRELGAGEATE
jgi:hypothetical protein